MLNFSIGKGKGIAVSRVKKIADSKDTNLSLWFGLGIRERITTYS